MKDVVVFCTICLVTLGHVSGLRAIPVLRPISISSTTQLQTASYGINLPKSQPNDSKEVQFINAKRGDNEFAFLPIALIAPLIFAGDSATLTSLASRVPPLLFLGAYLPCLIWGLPWSRIGSWKSLRSYWHRLGGVATLIVPLFFAIYERIEHAHVSIPIYLAAQLMIWVNVIMGMLLIPSRIPAYDIPTLRAFAVGVLLALAFSSMSLFYRFGHLTQYAWLGKGLALLAVYAVVYAWSDALQHVYRFLKGDFKADIGKKWFLPHRKSSLSYVFITCLTKQPTAEELQASVSPSNAVTTATTFLTAIFASIALLQTRYLFSGPAGMQAMLQRYPEVVRWSCYEALLAVVANNFGTFAGTLVLQNRVPQPLAGLFNALGLFIPVLHVLGFVLFNPQAMTQLATTSFGRLL